jgi:hypothetical protein
MSFGFYDVAFLMASDAFRITSLGSNSKPNRIESLHIALMSLKAANNSGAAAIIFAASSASFGDSNSKLADLIICFMAFSF